MQQHKLGRLLLASLGLLLLSDCRTSIPPKIEICIGDGFGGADCIEADGTKLYRSPSSLKNYWMTSQPDEANFTSWCYQATPAQTEAGMQQIQLEIERK